MISSARVVCFLCIYLTKFLKKESGKDSGEKKKRMMSMELKREIIEKHE